VHQMAFESVNMIIESKREGTMGGTCSLGPYGHAA